MSVAKMMGAMYVVVGLLLVPFFLLAGIAIMATGKAGEAAPMIVFAVIAPAFYGGMGFVVGALMAWLYNLMAGKLGGVEVELG